MSYWGPRNSTQGGRSSNFAPGGPEEPGAPPEGRFRSKTIIFAQTHLLSTLNIIKSVFEQKNSFFPDPNTPPGGLKILPGVEIFENSPLAAAPRRPGEELDQAQHTKSCAGSQG